MEEALTKAGIVFETEYRHGLYSYDFAIPSIKLDIEVDGGTHQNEAVKRKDVTRDKWSTDLGWTVLRFGWYDIRHSLPEVIEQIQVTICLLSDSG